MGVYKRHVGDPPSPYAAGWCPVCGKQSFPSKKKAKKAGKLAHPSAHTSPYRCGEYWHYGNLHSEIIRRGHTARRDYYGYADRQGR